MATILDVAKEAGVSPATVSRVINNSPVVSATKRSHVLAAIEKLGYELPTTRTGSSGKLIIVVSTMPGLEIYNALYRAIEARGYQMLHYYYCEGPSTENELFDFLQTMAPTQKIAGIVLSSSLSHASAPLRNALNTYPVVQIGGGCCPLNQTIRFEVDPFRAAYDAASLLIDRGCRRIAICISDSTVSTDQSRLNGYRAAVLDHGLALDPALTIEADCTAEGAFEATEHLLKSGAPLPDGVIFPVDTMSVGCMNALNRNGVRVPEQIKLISLFDNWYSEFTTPGLSTLRFPYEQLSTEAIRYLDMLISGESVGSQTIHVPHSFVLRGSTGDPE